MAALVKWAATVNGSAQPHAAMQISLIQALAQVRDFRTPDGLRHPLWFVLLLVILGTLSGYRGYRALGDFAQRHRQALVENFGLAKQRVPSYSTIRRVMLGVDFTQLAEVFNAWARQCAPASETPEWLAIDGKSIRGTMTQPRDAQQNFVSIVSAFSAQRGLVLGLDRFENQHQSEIVTVQSLLQALRLEGVVFSLDALHCQKNSLVNGRGGQ